MRIGKPLVGVLLCVACASCDSSVPNPASGADQSAPSAASAPSASDSSSNSATPTWSVFSSVDKMTDVKSWYAISPDVNSVDRLRFPYTGTQANLVVACDKKSKWTYVIFSGSINLTGEDIQDGFDTVTTRIKWDSTIDDVTFTHKWGARSIQFESTGEIVKAIASHNTALLELHWYEQGRVYYRFPLDGARAAIAAAFAKCKASAAAASTSKG